MIKKEHLVTAKTSRIEDNYEFNTSMKIGSGAFGTVFKARLKGTKQFRAIKRIPKKKIKNPKEMIE